MLCCPCVPKKKSNPNDPHEQLVVTNKGGGQAEPHQRQILDDSEPDMAEEKKDDAAQKALDEIALPPLKAPFIDIKCFNTGTGQGTEDFLVRYAENKPVTIPLQAFLLTHPEEGHSFFDLGVPEAVEQDSFGRFAEMYAFMSGFGFKLHEDGGSTKQLEKRAQIKASEVKRVILSHFHFDHIGDLDSVPDAQLIMGEGLPDLVRGLIKDRGPPLGYNGIEIPPERNILVPTFQVSVGPFPRACDFFGDGSLYLIDSPGHAHGHIMALVRTEKKWVLLAGDAVHHELNYTGAVPRLKGFGVAPDHSILELDEDLNKSADTVWRIWRFRQLPNTLVQPAHVITDDEAITKP